MYRVFILVFSTREEVSGYVPLSRKGGGREGGRADRVGLKYHLHARARPEEFQRGFSFISFWKLSPGPFYPLSDGSVKRESRSPSSCPRVLRHNGNVRRSICASRQKQRDKILVLPAQRNADTKLFCPIFICIYISSRGRAIREREREEGIINVFPFSVPFFPRKRV